ncbi:hypothetical protein KEM54_004014 [Ascosphaera aggregata]|nr:hypothetical protein KEM54_004014 [Ascosphaera aggregata]
MRSRNWRTAQKPAVYGPSLVDALFQNFPFGFLIWAAGLRLTLDLAKFVTEGHVTGLDTLAAASIIDQVQAIAEVQGV